jgi:hypothetical protein
MREGLPTDDAFVFATADALSSGVPGADPVVVDSPPTAEAEPFPHVSHEMSWAPSPVTEPRSNRLALTLTGVGQGTVDLAAAGLDLCGLALDVSTDGPVDLRLLSAVDRRVFVTGAPGATIDRAHLLRLPAAGTFAVRLTCGGLAR